MIHMPLKWHHIGKCYNNCKKIDVLTLILVHLSSFAPTTLAISTHVCRIINTF